MSQHEYVFLLSELIVLNNSIYLLRSRKFLRGLNSSYVPFPSIVPPPNVFTIHARLHQLKMINPWVLIGSQRPDNEITTRQSVSQQIRVTTEWKELSHGLTDHRSRDQPISRSFLLPVLAVLFSPVLMANALLLAAKTSTSSFILPASTNATDRSESRSAMMEASSIHSRRLSRDKPVPAKCSVPTYARTVSGRYA
jgi:hypothetical protein